MIQLDAQDWEEIYRALHSQACSLEVGYDQQRLDRLNSISSKVGPNGIAAVRDGVAPTPSEDAKSDDLPEAERLRYVAAARRLHHRDGELEVDDDARVSVCPDSSTPGAYVQAWAWVYADDLEDGPPSTEEDGQRGVNDDA